MTKRWVLARPDKVKVNLLQQQLKIHQVHCELLIERGIETYEEAQRFFRPSLSHLHDPFLMQDMDKAISRILIAMQNKERILVYGDYDVDGTTSVSLVYAFLHEMYPLMDFYIPDRYTEGYGISYQGIDYSYSKGCKLIIALDCGIKAMEQIAYANSKGIDFIVCDHHRPGTELPEALAILDPKRLDCNYPYKELSGCGIGYKMLQAFCQKYHEDEMPRLNKMLDLVAVSIAADIVPITGENRTLAFFGLKQINTDPSPGIKQLLENSTIKSEITIDDIVFKLAPRINAAGRMDDAKNAVRLLIGDSTFHHAEKLQKNNEDRKQVDSDMTQQALEMLKNNPELRKKKTTVLFNPSWHKGVVGIVASRLIDDYYRPTIILTESNGLLTGSARSIAGFDIYDAIEACSEYLDKFGGHTYAAGLTMLKENLEAFIVKFEQYAQESLHDDLLIPEILIDAEIYPELIDEKFFKLLSQFAPFGPGNMRPVFLTRNLVDQGSKLVGNDHLQVLFGTRENKSIKGIAFKMAHYYDTVKKDKFDLCYVIDENTFNGRTSLQLLIKDIRPSQVEL